MKRPDTVLPDTTMENVLYDYHIAKAMGDELPFNEAYKRVLYVEAVYRKHGVTQAQFDSSMVWFARHPDVLTKIYGRVNQRLKAQQESINDLIALRDNKPKVSLPGDSIDVWAWQRHYRLTGFMLNNRLDFVLPSDSNFQNRDTLRWSVYFRFCGETQTDSMYVPLMALQICYDNDSVISRTQKVWKDGTEILSLASDTLGKIKEVRGFVYYPQQPSGRNLQLNAVTLMRYHATDTLQVAATDSLENLKAAPAVDEPEEPQPEKPAEASDAPKSPERRPGIRPRPSAVRSDESMKELPLKNSEQLKVREPSGLKRRPANSDKVESIRPIQLEEKK